MERLHAKHLYLYFLLIMKLYLDVNQYVCIDRNGYVRFHHISSTTKTTCIIQLRSWQFLNLNDVLERRMDNLTWYPLGKGMWFYKSDTEIKLVDRFNELYFRFYAAGWRAYKYKVHKRILSFLQHEAYAADHQSDARDESRPVHSSRKCFSTFQRRKRLSPWSSRNDCHEDESQRTKLATVSGRKNSNPGSYLKRRSRSHALRDCETATESAEDGEVSSISMDDNEYGGEPSVTLFS